MTISREIWGRVGARSGSVTLVRAAVVAYCWLRKNGRLGNLALPAVAAAHSRSGVCSRNNSPSASTSPPTITGGADTRHPVVCRSVQRGGHREDVDPRIPTLLGASQRV